MNFPNIDLLKMKPKNLNYKFHLKIIRIKSKGEGTQQEPGACSTQPQNVQEEWQTREEGCTILFIIEKNNIGAPKCKIIFCLQIKLFIFAIFDFLLCSQYSYCFSTLGHSLSVIIFVLVLWRQLESNTTYNKNMKNPSQNFPFSNETTYLGIYKFYFKFSNRSFVHHQEINVVYTLLSQEFKIKITSQFIV